MSDLIGRTLGSYQVVEQLGQGGMATVYKAYHPAMDRYVAIKVLPRHMAQDTNFRARFERETRTIAKLEHRYILPVHDSGETDGMHYMVMRYTDSGTLSDLIATGKLSYERAGTIVAQIAEALGYAHRQGVIHRDIKPANILISRDGDAQLSDFGIARIIEGSIQLTSDGMMIGTPFYMAPEQVQGQPSDARTDIYALGVVLYEALTGQRPYQAETPLAVALMHLHNPLPPPRQLQPNMPEALERIILRAMAKNPDDRFQTADQMAEALRAISLSTSQPIAALPPSNATITLPTVGTTDTTLESVQLASTPPPVPSVSPPTPPVPPPTPSAPAAPPLPKPAPRRPGWLIPTIAGVAVLMIIVTVVGFSTIRARIGRERVPTAQASRETAVADIAPATPVDASAPPAITEPESADSDAPVIGMINAGDHILVATTDGVARWQTDNSQLITTAQGLPFNDTRKILIGADGTFWLAGYEDLAQILPSDTGVKVLKHFTPADTKIDNVTVLMLESDGSLIAGGYLPSGLAHYENETWHQFQPPIPQEDLGELSGTIYSILRSSDGVLWLGTEIGLFQLKDDVWSRYDEQQGIGEVPIRTLIERGDSLWAAAVDHGLLRYNSDQDSWERVPIEGDSPIMTVAALADNSLWVGSQDYVARSTDDGATWTVMGTTEASEIHSAPSMIVDDLDGRVWVGAEEGLSYYDGSSWVTP